MTQIKFACRTFSTDDILKCSFDLNATDLEVLKILLQKKEQKCTDELTIIIKRDRTTIQRSLKNLLEKNLVIRKQKNASRGGYCYTYTAKDKNELKKNLNEIINSFHENLTNTIENI